MATFWMAGRWTALTVLTAAAVLGAPPEMFVDAPRLALEAERPAPSGGPAVVRSRLAQVDGFPVSGSFEATLNLFADVAPAALLRAQKADAAGDAQVWTANDAKGPNVVLSRVDGRLSGSVRLPDGRFFTIRAAGPGLSEIREVLYEPRWMGDDTVPAAIPAATAPLSVEPVEQSSSIDVLVVATPAAASAAGGMASIRDKANLAVAETNAGWAASGVAVQLRLIGVEQVDLGPGESASGGFLNTATDHPQVRNLRNQYGADAVSVWLHGPGANGGFIGLAWILQGQGAAFAPKAYSVVEQNFAAGPGYGFAHELGHNLGCAHDRGNASGVGAFPHSYGYQDPEGGFYTMMAYANGCPGCSQVNAWSTPSVSFNGRPAGVAQGQPNAADNASTLNATRSIAAAWRSGATAPPIPPAPTPPTPTPPTPTPPTPPPPPPAPPPPRCAPSPTMQPVRCTAGAQMLKKSTAADTDKCGGQLQCVVTAAAAAPPR